MTEVQQTTNEFQGQRWLVEERDACGVGFVADSKGVASHEIIVEALPALACMEHRGGCSADRDSGDGSGILTAIPWELLAQDTALTEETRSLITNQRQHIGVGMVFLPLDSAERALAVDVTEKVLVKEGFQVLGWRVVPVKQEVLGMQARETEPMISQLLVFHPTQTGDELERSLYLARRVIGDALNQTGVISWANNYYMCSFSCRTIVYKGMVRGAVLGEFYQDLTNPAYKSAFAVFHRRFSTNTMPRWPLAQPMRLLAHNGEINTLLGNMNWMTARQANLAHKCWGDRLTDLMPFVRNDNSDSANLDNVFELLVRSQRSPAEAIMMLVPEAFRNQPDLADHPEIVDFYDYNAGVMEAWDGPALLVFSDGKQVGASLDRNGLRPARYAITRSGLVVVASEAGVVPLVESEIVEKGRLGPGQMMVVDLESGEILHNWDIKQRVAQARPYKEWLQSRFVFERHGHLQAPQLDEATLLQAQVAFGYSTEDVEMMIQTMAETGKEATFCMGNDTPLAVLSDKPYLLYDYFKQRFAQVTNPAIDPLRESLVMSLEVYLGGHRNLLEEDAAHAKQLQLMSPILNEPELENLISTGNEHGIQAARISTLYEIGTGDDDPPLTPPSKGGDLAAALAALKKSVSEAVAAGTKIIILSDRHLPHANTTYIPPLLAVGTVQYHLIREGLRTQASIVVETAQCWTTHHFACLIGYGASAVCPYLALETVRHWWSNSKTQKMMERGQIEAISLEKAQENYCQAVEGGLLKILSKMGISLLASYKGAQIFEAIGIGEELLNIAFEGTVSRIGGLSIADVAREVMAFHHKAFPEAPKKLENFGFVQHRPSGEYHANNPDLAKLLHQAVKTNQFDHYQLYQEYLKNSPIVNLRDLLDLHSDRNAIDISEVEPVEEIVKRFCTGGMSLGALSPEAHETLAIAMNRMGGKSNSGEGGEDPWRFGTINDVDENGKSPSRPYLRGLRNGDTASSAIKQIASGRFGVTPEYLMSGKQLEIKVAQGAKPGEGGQLPGKKVSPYIAMLRKSKPGVPLISPPPHHDIYSIEDLAQLIFDLHQINPQAKVSVKLVAEIGIGTIAAGVAKANADIIQISGHDGGTGASPLSSIKHAGVPWELGLTEVHRTLMQNKLRDRVLLRVDGGMKCGMDVIMAALMGAEEYGFGSIAMIAEGCIMARICHMNSCPVGVTTQQEKLRKRFSGMPEHVVNFFYFVAEEVRQLLARLGYRSLNEVIGRADLLTPRQGLQLAKTKTINLNSLLNLPDTRENRDWLNHPEVHTNGPVLDDELLACPEIAEAIANHGTAEKTVKITNTDRSVGARISGKIASKYGNTGFSGQIVLRFSGSAGQSFGAFNISGMTLILEGEANDYVGKGMNGGEIIIKPSPFATFNPSENVIIGNTCLYGATGGTLFAYGQAGERFAVRNSLGKAVIEGAGDHCCEYMTGGVIVCLGKVGRNVGAGMTGGLAYFLDEDGSFPEKVNPEIVKIQRITSVIGERQLKELIEAHAQRTGSKLAQKLLADWENTLAKFWQVVPPSEENSPEVNAEGEKSAAGMV